MPHQGRRGQHGGDHEVDDVLDVHRAQPLVVLDVEPTGRTHPRPPILEGLLAGVRLARLSGAGPEQGRPAVVRARQGRPDPVRSLFATMRPRRTALLLAAILAGLTPLAAEALPPRLPSRSPPCPRRRRRPGPPNVVIILADDMGYGDLGVYGATLNKTPNLDRLAAEGVRMTDCRVPSALCTPSRAALLTGLYPPRTGLVANLPSGSPTEGVSDGIDDDEITLADALRERGYVTAAIGKWHLGSTVPYLPTRHGFDSYFGISNGDQTFLLLRGARR